MKMTRRFLAVLMAVVMIVCAVPVAVAEDGLAATGQCGDNVYWSFDESTGVLTISGVGAMTNYGYYYSPFYNNTAIKSVTIGNSVTSIGYSAFYRCTALTSVMIPDSVTSIGDYAFYYCSSLTSVTIPNSVTNIGHYAFYDCSGLTRVNISDLTAWCNTDKSFSFYYGYSLYLNGTILKDIEIPDSVTSFGDGAFRCCTSLKSVTILNSVTSIGYEAFRWCTSLESVTIPNSVTSIDVSAFSGCTALKSVTFPDSLQIIGSDAFYYCSSLKSVTIPDSVTRIYDYAFSRCDALKDVFYTGTEEQWNVISIGSYNEELLNATIHFSSEGTSTLWSQNFWVDGIHGVVDLQFNDNWFKKDSLEYEHELCRFCSKMAMLGYDQGDKGNLLPDGSRKQNELTSGLKHLGFNIETLTYSNNTARYEQNYFIVSKKIQVDNQIYDLVFAGFIGTYKNQWYSDFEPGIENEDHVAFNIAKFYVYEILEDYIKDHKYNYDTTKILLTGHSRGAAVANLLAAQLIDEDELAAAKNIYTYTFATPNVTTRLDEVEKPEYKRIFNIVNPEDFVTKCMLSWWGYDRYGRTFTLPSKTNTKKYDDYLKKVKKLYAQYREGKEYKPYKKGEAVIYDYISGVERDVWNVGQFYEQKFLLATTTATSISTVVGDYNYSKHYSLFEFYQMTLCQIMAAKSKEFWPDEVSGKINLVKGFGGSPVFQSTADLLVNNSDQIADAHLAETYCAFVSSMTGDDLIRGEKYKDGGRGEFGYYKYVINCPVDVEIYDKESNEIVGRITDNTVDEEVLAKENSIVVAVKGDEKTALLPFDGDYEVKLIGNDSGTMDYSLEEIDSNTGELSRVNFYDVPLEDGKSYTAETTSEDFVVSDHVLVAENGTVITPNQVLDGDDLRTANVAIQIEGGGNASGDGAYTAGDYAELEAVPFEDGGFIGWYSGEDLVSNETQYRFRVDRDVTFIARFTPHTHNYTAAVTTPATCDAEGVETYTCTCGDTYTETIPALGHTDEANDGYCDRCGQMMVGDGYCPQCGKIHNEPLIGWLIALFHRIIYRLTHLFQPAA